MSGVLVRETIDILRGIAYLRKQCKKLVLCYCRAVWSQVEKAEIEKGKSRCRACGKWLCVEGGSALSECMVGGYSYRAHLLLLRWMGRVHRTTRQEHDA